MKGQHIRTKTLEQVMEIVLTRPDLPDLPGAVTETCEDCGRTLTPEVMWSFAGHYIGTRCDCGPYARLSPYFPTREIAEQVLALKEGSPSP